MRKILLFSLSIILGISCDSNKNYNAQSHRVNFQKDSLPLVTNRNNLDDYIFQLHLEGIRYDSLLLVCANYNRSKAFRITGEPVNEWDWKFSVPDSIYRFAQNFFFSPIFKGEKSNINIE